MFSLYFVNSIPVMAGYKWIVKAYVIPCFKDHGRRHNLVFANFTNPPQGSILSVYFPDGLTGYACGDWELFQND
jgi:hypothetical protein